jgi:hypothetical protein
MKTLPALLLAVAVAASGIFVYHTWLRPRTPSDDYLSETALARLEEQMLEITRRRGGATENQRELRIAEGLRRLNLGLAPEVEGRVALVCEEFQQARFRFWAEPSTRKMSDEEYEHAYRAFVERHVQRVREVITDPQKQEIVIRSFVWDGRIIPRGGAR